MYSPKWGVNLKKKGKQKAEGEEHLMQTGLMEILERE